LGCFHGIRLAQVALSLDFLVPLALNHWISSSGVHTGCCLCPTYASHFVRTCWEDMSCYRYSYTSCGYKYVGHFRSFVYGGSTMQCFIWLNSYHMCGTIGTISAVTKVHCLCDVCCCLAVDRRRLQGSFSLTDMRILITYHVLLGKSALE
jgi:hypothetical protein